MSEKILIIGDGLEASEALASLGVDYEYIDLRKGVGSNEIMDIYETLHPEMISSLRAEIEALAFDRIVVIGASEEYRWNATIVTRIFGQFNSWLGQYQNPFAKTVIQVKGKDVPLIAIDKIEDWGMAHETSH